MRKLTLLAALLLGAATAVHAQQGVVVVDGVPVDQARMPGWTPRGTPDWSVMTPWGNPSLKADADLPDHWNNVATKYFPPRFNQAGGSCGPSSRIGYMLTHELNAYRGTDASLDENRLPPNFVYPFSYDGSSKDQMAIATGVPNIPTYGGFPYSSTYGFHESDANDAGWMTGYDKWYAAMFNRLASTSNFPTSTATTEGGLAVKRWLYNHNGDETFMTGGVLGLGCAAGAMGTKTIGSTDANKNAGVVGKAYVDHFGESVDHAITLVGWDDRVEFDLDQNGVYGEESNQLGQNEKGAWIIVNSWGAGWGSDGQAYVPYALAGSVSKSQTLNGKTVYTGGEGWWPEIYKIRKDYVPQRTVKATVSYTQRSAISISAGISTNLNATKPDRTVAFHHFNYQGDADKDGEDAMTPMLGKWGDNKLHYEPIEFGYDLSDLCEGTDPGQPLKFFFIVTSKATAQGAGGVHKVSIMDYTYDPEGVEIPFTIEGDSLAIQNGGKQVMLSVIVNGNGTAAPVNLVLNGNTLSWDKPAASSLTPTAYKVFAGDEEIAEVSATSYEFSPMAGVRYTVKAVFNVDGNTVISQASNGVTAPVASDNEVDNYVGYFDNGGFSIPEVFAKGLSQATIEFRIKPTSVANWNQQIGPNWGTFLIHTTSAGELVYGWNTDARGTAASALVSNAWRHVALSINGSTITVFVNGQQKSTYTATGYSGLPALSEFVFGSHGSSGSALYGYVDEVRIWDGARTRNQISPSYQYPLLNPSQYGNLLAYYKMDTIEEDGVTKLRDCVGGHHATFVTDGGGTARSMTYASTGFRSSMTLKAAITPTTATTVGQAYTFQDQSSPNAIAREWVIDGKTYNVTSPTVVFTEAGTKDVQLTVTGPDGATNTATTTITVNEGETPTAAFHASADKVSGSDRISFVSENTAAGCTYLWEMPGAINETATTPNASAQYTAEGTFTVRLTVTGPDGTKYTSTQQVTVAPSAPIARYTISNGVIVKGETVRLKDNSLYSPTSGVWTFTSPQNVQSTLGLEADFTPTVAGVYTLTYKAANDYGTGTATQDRALVVCNADSKQGLNFGGGAQTLTASKPDGISTGYTIGFWFKPMASGEGALGITAGTNGLSLKGNGSNGLTLTVGDLSVSSNDNILETNVWHHYAVSVNNGVARFYQDGELKGTGTLSGMRDQSAYWNGLTIGGEGNETVGVIDELWLFGKQLAQTRVRTYCVSPLDEAILSADQASLKLYYNFNHSSGNATDLSGNDNTGVRTGFGPDGDAWTDSKGVFALNFGTTQTVEPLGQQINTGSAYSVIAWSDQETVSESSPASKALDGLTSTFWHSAYNGGATGYPHSITIRRTDKTDIETVKFYYSRAEAYRASAVTVEVSDDGETWQTIEADTELANASDQYLFLARPVEEAYIRFTFTKGYGGTWLALNEITFYGGLIATGIDQVEAARDAQRHEWYDLQGRRVLRPTHGVYLRDGEKVYVK
ncbi:MAG: discoidin domain-containing protein [Bacteroidaceae bacterium]|nr:discoidin domain-containing protein [Bacteroidaceae bacterium]